MEKIGLMGGSFNPIHARHVAMARAAMDEAGLDKVLFLPSGNPPHKRDGLETADDRYRMTSIAIAREKGFAPSRLEIDRQGIIYTVDTLTLCHQENPSAQWYFIIGEDTLFELPHWRTPEKVFPLCTFLVCLRPGSNQAPKAFAGELEKQGAHFCFLHLPPLDISSTAIRQALQNGREPEQLNAGVLGYIQLLGLYGLPPLLPNARELLPRLETLLSPRRFAHTFAVVAEAVRLARLHDVNVQKAALAALLHDCAKCIPLPCMQALVPQGSVDPETWQSSNLLHSHAGAYMAQKEFGVNDTDVLNAIGCHTTGRIGMTPLDMIVYLSDKQERTREQYPGLDEIRAMSDESLPKAVALSLSRTVDYVKSRGQNVHPSTSLVLAWLQKEEQYESNPCSADRRFSRQQKGL